jgi:elongation factor Ts
MNISATQVRDLREKTGLGMMDCKKALTDAQGDMDKAVEILRKMGLADAEKRSHRATAEGRIGAYIHPPGRVGVLIEVNCETDFVAKSKDFEELTHHLCLHVAASRPDYVRREDVPAEVLERERDIYRAQVQGKPAAVQDKIVEGKVATFYKDRVLLDQPFVKDPKKTVADHVKGVIAKVGENIAIKRFQRFAVGEEG